MNEEQATKELLNREIFEAAHDLRHSLSNLFNTSEMISWRALREQLPAEDLREDSGDFARTLAAGQSSAISL